LLFFLKKIVYGVLNKKTYMIYLLCFKKGGQGLNISEEVSGNMIKKVLKALEKKATGFECKEVTEEYSTDGQNEVLTKRKVVKHYIPADISAAKLLLEICGTKDEKTFFGMSDEELDNEAIRLFKEYQALTDKNIYLNIKGEQEFANIENNN